MNLPTLDEFIASKHPNSYVEEPGFKSLYVRNTQRCLAGNFYQDVLDIANVTVRVQKQGTFTNLIKRLQQQYSTKVLFVENVMVPPLAFSLPRLGFVFEKPYSHTVTRTLVGTDAFFNASLYWIPS
jgi:hypothetical protein